MSKRLDALADFFRSIPGRRSERLYRILIPIGSIILISWMFPIGDQFEYRYDLNEITRDPIIAPFNFPVLKSAETLEQEREAARGSVPYLFRRDPQISTTQLNGVIDLFTRARRIQRAESRLAQSRQRAYRYRYDDRFTEVQQTVERDSTEVVDLRSNFALRFPLDLNALYWGSFFSGATPEGRSINYTRLQRELERIIRDILAEGVLDLPKSQLGNAPVALASEGVEETIELRFLLDLDEAWAKAKTRLQAQYPTEAAVESAVAADLLIYFIRPNLIYDDETTSRRQQAAVDKVPISKGFVLKNERIVDANTRVTPEILEKLNSLAVAKSQAIASAGGIQLWLPRIGMMAITIIMVAFFYAWLYVYRGDWYRQNRILLLTNLLIVLIMGIGSLFHHRFGLSEYLIPFTVVAMAFTILFDARTSIIATVSLALLMGFLVGNKVDFVLVNLLVGSVAIYAVRQLRRRRQIFTAIIYIVSAYVVGITAVEFLKYTNLATLATHLMYASINGLLSPIMVYGLIGVLEVIFGMTTNLTLLELSDFNHPLLRRLSREANGTFSHSIIVGNLAEAAANTIGANSLLCRVGAYYHDIGKLARPEYFIENQFRQENPHDTIAPHLSAKVVISHVKEGLRLAKEYGIPEAVANFIPMHHGTARVEYFYQKALSGDGGPEKVKEDTFRYSGPRPNTKETGILMICEAVEAATKSIRKPTLPRILQMMNTIIEMRMADGQLDECPLTLEEINRIKGNAVAGTGIIGVLKGIYHVRIPYPSTDKEVVEEKEEPEGEPIPEATVFEGTPTE
ncbi:MAG: HDIG domain-containing protein [Fidelibacterota bacterium]|nr:MAG: HDIG domain-containing protein [Candidatus Neomarinimicrobiota bacterium]